MGETLQVLRQRVLLGFPRLDGEAAVVIDRSINDALHAIATVRDFDELMTTDEENAFTSGDQKLYHWIDDWELTRPKKIYSIRLMDETRSRKLIFIPPRDLDRDFPYTEQIAVDLPTHYTTAGNGYFELIRTPTTAYPLYIRYSQWPAALTEEADESPFENLDTEVVFLAKDIANAYLQGDYIDFAQRAQGYLSGSIGEEMRQPDHLRVAQPFRTSRPYFGRGYDDPFVKRSG